TRGDAQVRARVGCPRGTASQRGLALLGRREKSANPILLQLDTSILNTILCVIASQRLGGLSQFFSRLEERFRRPTDSRLHCNRNDHMDLYLTRRRLPNHLAHLK